MNWTGGSLERSRNAISSTIAIQKKHFAKARAKSEAQRASPISSLAFDLAEGIQGEAIGRNDLYSIIHHDHIPTYSQSRLEDFKETRPIVKKLKTIRPKSRVQSKRSIPSHHDGSKPPKTRTIKRERSPITISSGSSSSSSSSSSEVEIVGDGPRSISPAKRMLSEHDSLEVKRRCLLQTTDWAGINRTKPAKITFTAIEDRDLIGKRRRLGRMPHSKEHPHSKPRPRGTSRFEGLMRSPHPSQDYLSQADVSVRIGSAVDRSVRDDRQSTRASSKVDSSNGDRNGGMLDDEQVQEHHDYPNPFPFDQPNLGRPPTAAYSKHFRVQTSAIDPTQSKDPVPLSSPETNPIQVQTPSIPEQEHHLSQPSMIEQDPVPNARSETQHPSTDEEEKLWRTFVFGSANAVDDEWTLEEPESTNHHSSRSDTSSATHPSRTQPSMLAEAATSPIKKNPHLASPDLVSPIKTMHSSEPNDVSSMLAEAGQDDPTIFGTPPIESPLSSEPNDGSSMLAEAGNDGSTNLGLQETIRSDESMLDDSIIAQLTSDLLSPSPSAPLIVGPSTYTPYNTTQTGQTISTKAQASTTPFSTSLSTDELARLPPLTTHAPKSQAILLDDISQPSPLTTHAPQSVYGRTRNHASVVFKKPARYVAALSSSDMVASLVLGGGLGKKRRAGGDGRFVGVIEGEDTAGLGFVEEDEIEDDWRV